MGAQALLQKLQIVDGLRRAGAPIGADVDDHGEQERDVPVDRADDLFELTLILALETVLIVDRWMIVYFGLSHVDLSHRLIGLEPKRKLGLPFGLLMCYHAINLTSTRMAMNQKKSKGEATIPVFLRVPPKQLALVDAWRKLHENPPTRPKAVLKLLEFGLDAVTEKEGA